MVVGASVRRVGIYAGTFDPVHAGHVAFALQAAAAARLDAVYFLPERRPRDKRGVEHFGHRVAMLKRALRPHRQLKVLELEDISFSVERTLPRLNKRFAGSELVFLIGSDVTNHMIEWPNVGRLLKNELVVGMRSQDRLETVETALQRLQASYVIIDSFAAEVSSRRIREALRARRRQVPGLLASVARYSDHNWLYVSLSAAK